MDHLYPSVVTLAEIMQQQGYRTYGVLNNPAISAKLGFAQGFEKYENEQAQVASNSVFKSFYFLDDWQEFVHSTQGDISWEDGALKIVGDSQAQIVWKVTFPQPMLKGQLQFIAYCDKPIPFLALSRDLKDWISIYRPKEAKPEFTKMGFDLTHFAGTQTLYLKIFQPSSAHTYLRGFYIHAQFSEREMEVDEKTKQNLKTLGYLE